MPPLNLGAAAVDALHVGSGTVDKLYLGSDLLWPPVVTETPSLVQRGTVTLTSVETQKAVALATPVDTSRSWVTASFGVGDSNDPDVFLSDARFTTLGSNVSELTFTRGKSGTLDLVFQWQVITSPDVSVQHFPGQVIDALDAQLAVTLPTPVDLSKTFAVTSFYCDAATSSETEKIFVASDLSAVDTLTLRRGATGLSVTCSAQVIEFTSDATVQHLTVAAPGLSTTTPITAVDLASTWVVHSWSTDDNSLDTLPYVSLDNTTTLNVKRAAGSAGSATVEAYVISQPGSIVEWEAASELNETTRLVPLTDLTDLTKSFVLFNAGNNGAGTTWKNALHSGYLTAVNEATLKRQNANNVVPYTLQAVQIPDAVVPRDPATVRTHSAAVGGGGSTAWSVSLFQTAVAGNLLVLLVGVDKSGGTVSATDNIGTTPWTSRHQLDAPSVTLAVLTKVADGGETTVDVSTTAAGPGGNTAIVVEVENAGTVSGLASTLSDNSTVTSVSTGTGVAGYGGLAIAASAIDSYNNLGTKSWTNGFTTLYEFTGLAGHGTVTAGSARVSAGSVETTFSHTGGADQMSAAILVVEDAAAEPGGGGGDPELPNANVKHRWVASDLTGLAENDPVGTWTARIGGVDLEPIVAGDSGRYRGTWFNGNPAVSYSTGFYGSHQSAAAVDLAQPYTIYFVGADDSGIDSGNITEWSGSLGGRLIPDLFDMSMSAGTTLGSVDAGEGRSGVFAATFNGVTSRLARTTTGNSQQKVEGDAGTADLSGTMSLMQGPDLDVYLVELIICEGAHDATQRAEVLTYVENTYGLTLTDP